jgi:hypothetical protein
MTENEWPPGTDVIDVFLAVDVPDVRTVATLDKERFAANGAKCANW